MKIAEAEKVLAAYAKQVETKGDQIPLSERDEARKVAEAIRVVLGSFNAF